MQRYVVEKEFYEGFHFIKSAKCPQNHVQFRTEIFLVSAIMEICFPVIYAADVYGSSAATSPVYSATFPAHHVASPQHLA